MLPLIDLDCRGMAERGRLTKFGHGLARQALDRAAEAGNAEAVATLGWLSDAARSTRPLASTAGLPLPAAVTRYVVLNGRPTEGVLRPWSSLMTARKAATQGARRARSAGPATR
jgi:hypothetical protein